MRLELLEGDETQRPVGAIVVHGEAADVFLDAGPADGPPLLRIRISRAEALRLSANLRAVANGRDEEVLLADS